MATKTFNTSLTMLNTAPSGNVKKSFGLNLEPAEAKVLRQIRDGFVLAATQPANTGVDRTLRILLQQIATNLANA